MSKLLVYFYAALAGGVTNVQVGADLRLSKGLANPALTAAVVLATGFAVSLTVLAAWWAIAGVAIPKRADLLAIPWWAWVGGGLQGLTIFAVFATAGIAGAAFFSALTVTGGAIASVLLDQYGLVGFTQHPFTWTRGVAVLFLVAGTVLMSR